MTSKVPAIQFDLLARIVPGSFALATCFFEDLRHLEGAVNMWLALISSYVAGFLLQVTSDKVLGDILFGKFFRHFRRQSKTCPASYSEMWTYRYSEKGKQDDLILKRIGEISMLHSLILLCVAFSVCPPPVLAGVNQWLFVACFILYGIYRHQCIAIAESIKREDGCTGA